MEKNWLTLHPDTFLWLKNDTGLVYNAKNKKRSLFSLSESIERLCHRLLKTENLYTVELTDEDLHDDGIERWIHSLIKIQAGYLSHNVAFEKRPVSLNPILKIQDKKEHYEWQHIHGAKGKILQNLHELTFYINESKYGNDAYFKQHIFPLKNCQNLDISQIHSFVYNSRNPFLSNINWVGNLFSHPDYEKIWNTISDLSIQCTIHIMIQDFFDYIQKIKEIDWPNHVQFNILVDTVFDLSLLSNLSLPFSFTAFVFSEKDYEQFSTVFEVFPTNLSTYLRPLYNKHNLHFFESKVFIEKDDLDHIDLSKHEIFMHQTLNIEHFGKLTIMPDGFVYANVNMPPLGNTHDSPYSIVYKEFTEGKSWLRIRNQAPCTDCVYQWLCPPPSDYEIAIGHPNLCHVKP